MYIYIYFKEQQPDNLNLTEKISQPQNSRFLFLAQPVVGRVAGDLDRGRFRPRLGGGKRGVRMRVFSMGCESWGVKGGG